MIMYSYDVTLRNAAGREVTRLVSDNNENRACDRAVRNERRATGEDWYVVTCWPRGREIRA